MDPGTVGAPKVGLCARRGDGGGKLEYCEFNCAGFAVDIEGSGGRRGASDSSTLTGLLEKVDIGGNAPL